MAIAAARLDALPPDLYPFILQRLHLRELTRLYQVSRSWQERADDAEAWILLLPEFDPLHIIGRQGLDNLHQQLGTWSSVARSLATQRSFATFGRRSVLCNYCEQCDQFCCSKCEEFCRGFSPNPDTTSFQFQLLNRWSFCAPQAHELRGVGTTACGLKLRQRIDALGGFDTLVLRGSFLFTNTLIIDRPVCLVGADGAGATINLFARAVEVRGGAMLKNLTIFTSHNRAIVDAHRRDVCDGEECEECDYHVFAQGADTISPALVITNDDPGFDFRPYLVYGLIAEGLRVTSTVGSAVLIDENASAAFHQCSMHSYVEGCNVTMCLGVMAKANATLTMNGCTLSRCRWGVFAGTDGERLRAGDNFFHGNELEDIALDLYAEAGILVQPWASPDAGLRRALT